LPVLAQEQAALKLILADLSEHGHGAGHCHVSRPTLPGAGLFDDTPSREHSARMNPPDTKYTKVGDSYVAYQVLGDGPLDLLFMSGLASHVDMKWEYPPWRHIFERLSSFSRFISFDRRGAGVSDPVPLDALPTWEDWIEDVSAVLDATESEQTAILALGDGGSMAMLYAASHPGRVSALVLINSFARYFVADDYPMGATTEQQESLYGMIEQGWGTEAFTAVANPSMAEDQEFLQFGAKYMRASVTPRVAVAQNRYTDTLDARSSLPLIQVPTLILHNHSAIIPIEHGRFLAEHIPGARFIEFPSTDISLGFTESTDEVLDHVEEFLTGHRRTPPTNRVLATVLFTDIVGSTERAAQLGDHRWKELLDRLDRVTQGEVEKFGGRLINTTWDGHLATFDGPGRAIRCARSLVEAARGLGVEIRVGLHTGECELRGADVGGIAVHIGARVAAEARPSEVLVSRTVTDLVAGSGIDFDDRGEHVLRGVPGEWRLFAVKSL
jgi:class 3 adenylate cyclase